MCRTITNIMHSINNTFRRTSNHSVFSFTSSLLFTHFCCQSDEILSIFNPTWTKLNPAPLNRKTIQVSQEKYEEIVFLKQMIFFSYVWIEFLITILDRLVRKFDMIAPYNDYKKPPGWENEYCCCKWDKTRNKRDWLWRKWLTWL